MDKHVGSLLKITTTNGEVYQGIVQNIVVDEKKVVLKKVKNCQTGEVQEREVHMFGDQIANLEILQSPVQEGTERQKPVKGDSKTEKLYNKGSHEKKFGKSFPSKNQKKTDDSIKKDNLLDPSDTGSSLTQLDHINPSAYLSGYDRTQRPKLNEPPLAVLLDSLNNEFDKAVESLKKQKVLSLIAEGQAVNRFGQISLLTVASRGMVYLLDLESFGSFPCAFKDLIEDANILKVVHDVRMTSDCLYHIYGISPRNVFDTQVADAFVKKQTLGEFPIEVASLAECVETYLGVQPCMFEIERLNIIKKSKNIWKQRPFQKDILSVCAEACMYLRELRSVMMEKLLAEYLCGVDIYLEVGRNMTDNQIKLINSKQLPREFSRISNLKQNRANRFKNGKQHYEKMFTDKSRSDWDAGVNFHKKYHEKHGSIVECLDSKSVPLIDCSKPILKKKDEGNSSEKIETLNGVRDVYNRHESNIAFNSSVSLGTSKKDNCEASSDGSSNDWSSVFPSAKSKNWRGNPKTFHDDYVMSTSSGSDDGVYFVSSNLDKPLNETHLSNKISDSEKLTSCNLFQAGESRNNHIEIMAQKPNITGSTKLPADKFVSDFKNMELRNNTTPPFSNEEVKTSIVQKSYGRGRYLNLMSEFFEKNPVGITQRAFGEKEAFDFPSDEEILETPHVIPMVANLPLLSQSVSVLKKTKST